MKKRFSALLLILCLLFVGACTPIESDTNSADGSKTEESKPVSDSKPDSSAENETSEFVDSSADNSEESSEESSEEEQSEVIKFLACPDNIVHPSVFYHALETAAANKGEEPDYDNLQTADYDFSGIYKNVASYISEADIAYINVETLIGGNDNPISGYPTFNSPEAAGEKLLDLGFDVFNLAHNHMLDSYNDKYLKNCDRFFTERGGTTIGYYEDKADTDNIVVYECKGVKIAFLAYTYSTNGVKLPSSSSTYIPYINSDLIDRQMKAAKELADLVFVSMHWGDEDHYTVNSQQRSTAQQLVDLGADVIIGMHPHVLQESKWVEREDGTRCLLTYSLGNFISGMYGGKNALGSMLSFDIVAEAGEKPTVENVQIIPTVCHYVKEKSGVSGMDSGFRGFEIYLLEDYTAELAAAHGVHKNKSKINAFDKALDGNFSLETLNAKVEELIPAEFLD